MLAMIKRPVRRTVNGPHWRRSTRTMWVLLSFRSTAQEEWALNNGFPSVEELTEAPSMTTEELKDRAGTGKSGVRNFDRLLDEGLEQIRLVGDGGSSIESYLKTSEGRALISGIRRQSEAVLRTESPFAGYLLFRYNDEFTGNRNAAIASLAFAVQRGDRRLNRTIRTYADRDGISQQALEILSEYSVMTQHSLDEHPDLIPIQ